MFKLRPALKVAPIGLLVMTSLLLPTTAKANMNFFMQVMRNLQHYKLSGDHIDLDLEGQGTGNLTFVLTVPSRRNNIEEVVMVGYLSAGYAIQRTGLKVGTIYVNAIVTNDNDRMVVSTADIGLLSQMVNQQVDPHTFLAKIEWQR